MSKPKFCPGCGQALQENIATVERIDSDGKPVWDTYCKNCGWTGRISPDIEEVEVL
jgi:RNase P subunit RPR2